MHPKYDTELVGVIFMGLWNKIKKGVKKAGIAVEDFVNDVGDAVGNAVEAVGSAI